MKRSVLAHLKTTGPSGVNQIQTGQKPFLWAENMVQISLLD
jgi:hypothetical protein